MRIVWSFALSVFLILPGAVSVQATTRMEALGALQRATAFLRSISTHGGYVGIYSADLDRRFGQNHREPAQKDEIWMQPPGGTPTIGMCFLRAYEVTKEQQFLQAATDAALAVAWAQRANGGWWYLNSIGHFRPLPALPVRLLGPATLDDENTQSAISFLMEMDRHLETGWLTNAIDLGLEFLLTSQFENGAWPQAFPHQGNYRDLYTFNDKAISSSVDVLLLADRLYPSRPAYRQAALRAGHFVVDSQYPAPQPGWAQQYDQDLEPAGARWFEPAAISSHATARNIELLLDLYLETADPLYLRPLPGAIEWLERSRIDDDHWAMYYEVGTNEPIFLPGLNKRQKRWSKGRYGIPRVLEHARHALDARPGQYQDYRRQQDAARREFRSTAARDQVVKVVADLDELGRWLLRGEISTRLFVKNCRTLVDVLERPE